MYIFSPVFTCSANHFKPPFNPLSFIFITSAQHKSYCVHRSGATDGWDCRQMKRTTFKCFDNYKETSGQFPAGFADDRSRYFFLAKTWCFFPNQLGFVPQPSQRIINPLPWHKKKKKKTEPEERLSSNTKKHEVSTCPRRLAEMYSWRSRQIPG